MNYWKERTEQICTMCKAVKPLVHFYKRSKTSHLYRSRCIECSKKIDAERKANRTVSKEERRRWYENRMAAYPEAGRADAYRRKYGITIDDYNAVVKEQDGLCAICKDEERSSERRLVVDHCHKTNKVRKLLCYRCNWGIGIFNEDPDFMDGAIEYLMAAHFG